MVNWLKSISALTALLFLLLPHNAAAGPAELLAQSTDLPFTVCFRPQAPKPVSSRVEKEVSRIKPVIQQLSKNFLHGKQSAGWLEALVIHESGGDPLAVSPTGCAGLLAFARPFDQNPQCCKRDEGDKWEYEYDLCSSEIINGYGCSYSTDARFNPSRSLERGFKDLERFWMMLESAAAADTIDTASALTVFWNAGTDLLPAFPKGLKSEKKLLERINFTGVAPYYRWTNHGRANKLIEIYDYAAWLSFLRGRKLQGQPALICIDYRPQTKGAAGENSVRNSTMETTDVKQMFPIAVKRLHIGSYDPDTAWIAF